MADLELFPENYEDARRRFAELTDAAAGPKQIEKWPVLSGSGEDLSTDAVYFPPLRTPKILFVIISGVHGLEGYAGHAIQAMLLKQIWPNLIRDHAGFLFVHALNPFGFKHHRRNTESGVNLNRNCSANPTLYAIDNHRSLELSDLFIPKRPVDSEECHLLKCRRRVGDKWFFGDVSMDEFIKEAGLGQYESPAGLEYGGRGPEPQITRLIQTLRQHMPQFQDVVLLDLHTGLGERARLHLLTGDVDGCVDPTLFAELFRLGEDPAVYDFTSADSEGFYPTHGATNNLFPELARPGQRVCAMTMEFGTLGHSPEAQLESLNQWMLEHQGHLYGYARSTLEKKVREDYLERFFPRDSQWRETILGTSREFLTRVFRRSHLLK